MSVGALVEALLASISGKLETGTSVRVSATQGTPAAVSAGWPVKITDGVDTMAVGVGSDWSTALNPLTAQYGYVAALNHQLWPASPARPGVTGDGQFYGQLMNDLGDLVVSLGSLTTASGSIQILAGEGASGTGSPRVTIAGQVAHDAADSGNPLKIGGKARTTNPTAVADADRVDAYFDDVGRPVVTLGVPRDLIASNAITLTNTTTETTLLAAGGAGVFHDVFKLLISNTSASDTRVDIRDATAGTVRESIFVPAGSTVGWAMSKIRPQTTANNNWTAQCSAAVTDVRVSILADKNV